MDGVKYSNTYLFAKKYGWRGFLIEPVKRMFEDLVINRPESECHNLCVGASKKLVDFVGDDHVAAVREGMSQGFLDKWHKESSSYKIQQVRMSDIISSERIKNIDLLSLDVEGSELSVLQGMDQEIRFHVIIIETNKFYKERTEECSALLKEALIKTA